MPRRLVYYVATTVDGFIARKDGGLDCFLYEGEHFADLFARFPETFPVHLRQRLGIAESPQRFDTVLMGRSTYELGLRAGVTSPYTHLRQYVFSRTMRESPDAAVQLWSGDPVELVRQLKTEDGMDIWLCGGAKLAAAVEPAIDELILKINPFVIGDGIPLFDKRNTTMPVSLAEHRAYPNGFVLTRYVRR